MNVCISGFYGIVRSADSQGGPGYGKGLGFPAIVPTMPHCPPAKEAEEHSS